MVYRIVLMIENGDKIKLSQVFNRIGGYGTIKSMTWIGETDRWDMEKITNALSIYADEYMRY